MVAVGSVGLGGTHRAAAGGRGGGGERVTEIDWLKTDRQGGAGRRRGGSGGEGVCEELLPRR